MNTKKRHPMYVVFIIVIIVAVLILISLYFLYLHPVVRFAFPSASGSNAITQLEVYEEEKYLDYEYGDELKNYISSISLLCDGKPVGFYYRDNHKYDSLVYGKIPDIMSVDIQLNDQAYEKLQKDGFIEDYQQYKFIHDGSYELYYPKDIAEKEYFAFFALNDEKKIFRGMIITGADFESTTDITGYLIRWCELSFE